MNKITEIIQSAKEGSNPACLNCSRNPKQNNTAFAYNCEEHFGVQKHGIIIMMRDPGAKKGGASHTGTLCPIHNSDKTANSIEKKLFRLQEVYNKIYFLNAILHGFYDKNSKERNEEERNNCKEIIKHIISELQPKVILAFGIEALQTSIEVLKQTTIRRPSMSDMVTNSFAFGSISNVNVFGMPHPAYSEVNLKRHYNLIESQEWEKVLGQIVNIMGIK